MELLFRSSLFHFRFMNLYPIVHFLIFRFCFFKGDEHRATPGLVQMTMTMTMMMMMMMTMMRMMMMITWTFFFFVFFFSFISKLQNEIFGVCLELLSSVEEECFSSPISTS